MLKYTIEKKEYSNTDIITVIGKNAKQETMTMEITHCTNPGGVSSLPNMWYKNGYTDIILNTYLCVDTYVYDSEGNCWGLYNIQTEDNRNVINFDYMLEDTPENMTKLIEACINLFESATGKSATEIKVDKINEFAAENNMEVINEMPEGWIEFPRMGEPYGSVRVANGKKLQKVDGKFIRNRNYQDALLII